MIRVPGMLLIGATERKIGKTGLVCEILRRFSPHTPVTAIKATVISDDRTGCHRPDGGCGSCAMAAPFELFEEKNPEGPKDTARMLTAGASRVFWLKTRMTAIPEALAACLKQIATGSITVCESNRLRKYVEPDVFLILKGSDPEKAKPTVRSVEEYVDGFVGMEDGSPALSLKNDRWCLKRDATAIILAGGQSTRMGTDKSQLRHGGSLLIERTLNTLRPHFAHLMLSANDPAKFKSFGVPVVRDMLPGEGPLMAITSALEASRTDLHFIMACDMPGFNADLFTRLMRAVRGYDAVIPIHEGRHEPLFAVYRKSVLPLLRSSLRTGNRRITAALEGAKVNYFELPARDIPINLNTPADLETFLRSSDAHA